MEPQTQTTTQAGDIEIKEVEKQVFRRTSKNSKYIIEYHRENCTGIGTCSQIAQNTFVMDDENKAQLVELPVTEDTDDEILAAAQSCPVFAIFIFDKETGEQIFPPPLD